MRKLWPTLILIMVILYCFIVVSRCYGGYEYVPPPSTFDETDLIGTWQATYGTPNTTDTITLKANRTYQQVFQSPASDYSYESSWNKWHVERGPSGRLTLHLEGMRYYGAGIEIGEAGGRHSDGHPVLFFDINDMEKNLRMTDKVILRIEGNEHFPKGIILWHMHIDLDASPAYFVFVNGEPAHGAD